MKKKNITPGFRSARPLADDELDLVSGGVAEGDRSADQTGLSDAEMDELRTLTGDPEALNKKLAELQAQGRLISVVETLSGSSTAPAEDAPAGEEDASGSAGPDGLVIHHNAAALSALAQFTQQGASGQALSKPSGGMKINSAADEPSGYQISERMRVRIRSLDQANYNAQNGRSMQKAAEGALSSTVGILHTIKEKVISAANDIGTEVDRDAIQKEIDALIQQIDDNALLTFNGEFLDNGARTAGGEATGNEISTGQTGAEAAEAAGAALASLRVINGGETGAGAADTVTFSIVQDGKVATVSIPVGDLSFSGLPSMQADNGGASMSDTIKLVPDGESVPDTAHAAVQTPDNGAGLRFVGTETGIDRQISAISGGGTDANGEQRAAAGSVLDTFTEGIAARNASGDGGVSMQIGANANQRMNLSLDDMRASALGLSGGGVTVSVADKTSATAALKVIDNALQRALAQEASIGAVMNRLEFTSNNLTTTGETLQSAESTYRDADMAKEMTEFTKNNILMQAATAMLAQANRQNQGMLSLLQ